MMGKKRLSVLLVGALTIPLAACSNSPTPAPTDSPMSLSQTSDAQYADYAGHQFSGKDPWEGTLSVTIESIVNGNMDWTFTDEFEGHKLFQTQKATPLHDGTADFDIQGRDAERDNVSFAYRGTLELKDGNVVVTLLAGAVTEESPEGGSSYHFAEALLSSGLSNQVVLDKVADDS